MTPRLSIGVLASGEGTTFSALAEACASGLVPAKIAVLISNNPEARALERARTVGVHAVAVSHLAFASRQAFDSAVIDELDRHNVELVVLAGFMRILTPAFIRRFHGRILNVHPSLLPAFPGVAAHRQALDYGVRLSGCTVHFVDEGTDTGPIVAQAAVPVLQGDTSETLHARIQAEEKKLLLYAVALFAGGQLRIEGRKVRIDCLSGQMKQPCETLAWPDPSLFIEGTR